MTEQEQRIKCDLWSCPKAHTEKCPIKTAADYYERWTSIPRRCPMYPKEAGK